MESSSQDTQSLNGTCRHRGQKTGLLQRDHPQCRQSHQVSFTEMIQLTVQARGGAGSSEYRAPRCNGGGRNRKL